MQRKKFFSSAFLTLLWVPPRVRGPRPLDEYTFLTYVGMFLRDGHRFAQRVSLPRVGGDIPGTI